MGVGGIWVLSSFFEFLEGGFCHYGVSRRSDEADWVEVRDFLAFDELRVPGGGQREIEFLLEVRNCIVGARGF